MHVWFFDGAVVRRAAREEAFKADSGARKWQPAPGGRVPRSAEGLLEGPEVAFYRYFCGQRVCPHRPIDTKTSGQDVDAGPADGAQPRVSLRYMI